MNGSTVREHVRVLFESDFPSRKKGAPYKTSAIRSTRNPPRDWFGNPDTVRGRSFGTTSILHYALTQSACLHWELELHNCIRHCIVNTRAFVDTCYREIVSCGSSLVPEENRVSEFPRKKFRQYGRLFSERERPRDHRSRSLPAAAEREREKRLDRRTGIEEDEIARVRSSRRDLNKSAPR